MPSIRIQQSHYFRTPRLLYPKGATAWAVLTPDAPQSSGERVNAGQPVGTTTGQLVQMPGQAKGVYFLEVNRPRGGKAWVLNSFTKMVTPNTVPPKPVTKAPAKAPAPKAAPKAAAPKAAPKAPAPKPAATRPKPATKTGDGEAVLRSIVANDLKTHEHLVRAYYHRARAQKAGAPGADNAQLSARLAALASSYNTRQQKLRTSTLIKATTGLSKTVRGWWDKLRALVPGMSGIGALPVLAVPVLYAVGAVVVSAGAGALWLYLSKDEPRSAADAKEAFHLTQAYQQLDAAGKKEVDEALDMAAEAGVEEGKEQEKNSVFGMLKDNILLVGGGILLFTQLSNRRKKG